MRTHLAVMALILSSAVLIGCSSNVPLAQRVDDTVISFRQEDPDIARFFDSARGYAVFPTVAKGGVGIGGAHGDGELFEQGRRIGRCELTQGSIGFQLGGQAYSELIFFETNAALNDFKNETFAFSAQASAVAAKAGASATADYADGVAVFTMPKGGLMYEASVGGQKFSYTPYGQEP
jgi:lipid-binding SYLF domain-containing protein